MPMVLLGYFLGALFFTGLFQGGVLEALTAGAAGVVAGLCVMGLSKLEVNFFFKTIAAAAVLGMVIYGLRALGLPVDTGIAAISALMVLVPGLVFTNFMCDLITGDMVSGLSTFVRAVLTATAIAIGTGVALGLFQTLGLAAEGVGNREDYGAVLQCLAAFLACSGFCVMYNVHGWGVVLCCLGGALGWAVYLPWGWSPEAFICGIWWQGLPLPPMPRQWPGCGNTPSRPIWWSPFFRWCPARISIMPCTMLSKASGSCFWSRGSRPWAWPAAWPSGLFWCPPPCAPVSPGAERGG